MLVVVVPARASRKDSTALTIDPLAAVAVSLPVSIARARPPLVLALVVVVLLLLLLEDEKEEEAEEERRGAAFGISRRLSWPKVRMKLTFVSTSDLAMRSGLSKLAASGTPRKRNASEGPYSGGLVCLRHGRWRSSEERACWSVAQRSPTSRFKR